MNQRDSSPCCHATQIVFPSLRKVMCVECLNYYRIDYDTGEVFAKAGTDYPNDWFKIAVSAGIKSR